AWIDGDKLCGLGVMTLGSPDLVGDYAYQEFDLATGKALAERRIDLQNNVLPYFYVAALRPDDNRIYGFGRTSTLDSETDFVFKSAPAGRPEEAKVISHISAGDRCHSFCWHPVDKCFYGVNTWGKFMRYTLDGKGEVIFDTGISDISNNNGGMVYSPYDGYILWSPSVMGPVARLYAIYPSEERMETLHVYSSDRQFSFFVCPDFNVVPQAPAAPENVSAQFDKASLSGTIDFTMPSESLEGKAVNSAMEWTLYANGKAVSSGTAEAAQSVSSPVVIQSDGMYTFRVEASLNGNKGVPGVTRLYVGNDVPSAPAEVKLGDAEISWTPVTGGASNGYVDLSAITYEVYLNDQLVGTTAASSLAYSLDPEKEVDAYRAGVVAVAAGKRSEKTVSEKRILGKPLQLPVTIVPTAHQADLVTVFNLDGSPDYGVWTASDLWGDLCFSSGWSYEQPDDWLILPATEFPTADVQYSLSIEAARGGSIG
ncbi:MAG: hypothetical protein K2F63_03665, partial [Muribaculaceae bacterium]|nr:hypothetical protein [Muribaculaceae bacterium]